MGLACEGFSDGVHWISDRKSGSSQKPTTGKRGHLTSLGIRHHLYTGSAIQLNSLGVQLTQLSEQYRRSMGALISKGLVSGSIDASLQEIDLRSQDPSFISNSETQVGPFAVINFAQISSSGQQQEHTSEILDHHTYPSPSHLDGLAFNSSSYPVFDIPGCADEVLQWSDLFNTGDDFQAILSDPSFGLGSSLDFQDSSQLNDPFIAIHSELDIAPHQPPILEQPFPPINILEDAPFLLQTFQRDIVPQMTVVPLAKSPWNILNVPLALVTLGELTIMESQDVKHAQQANLYSLLACSAIFLETSPSAESLGSSRRGHWKEVAEQAYSKASNHMDISLAKESRGAGKAKLKDQLMALYGLIEFAVGYFLLV